MTNNPFRTLLKRTAHAVAVVLVFPLLLLYWIRLFSFLSASQGVALIPGSLGIYLRRAWYGATLEACGEDLVVFWLAVIRTPKTRVGNRCYFGPGTWVGWADVGDDLLASGQVMLLSGGDAHGMERTDVPMREQGGEPRKVTVGRDVWIGASAVVMDDLGEGSVVAAGAVVTKPVVPYAVVGGVPARVLRDRRDPQPPVDPPPGA